MFISFIGIGVQGLVASIFGSGMPGLQNLVLRELPGSISFIGGVIYFFAEQTNLLLDVATNLRKIETTLSVEEVTSD